MHGDLELGRFATRETWYQILRALSVEGRAS